MKQYLKRGYELSSDCRVTRMLSAGDNWQIYFTNTECYALVVTPELYDNWVKNYLLPTGIFQDELIAGCKVLLSTGKYIISSMENGPYPEDNGQVEAFSIAFKTAKDLFADIDVHDAIYIEEYSFLLPVSNAGSDISDATVYARWLTGGINVSIEAFERVSKIMSWLSPDLLLNSAHMAGFDIDMKEDTAEDSNDLEIKEPIVSEEKLPAQVSLDFSEKFTLIGRPELEQFFNDNIIDIVLHQEQYKRMGISFPGATILYGPPGCGKTYAVERLSEYLGWQRFDVDSSTIASSYIHDTSKKISEVFQNAIKASPSIIVIDEMEAFLTNRSMAGPSGTHHVEEVAEFLRRIPEAISKGVLVFAMTNMIDSIDPAILRRGRFDHIIEVKMATAEEIEALLINKFTEIPVDATVDTKSIANELNEHPMSDITFVLREAGRFAVKRNLEKINKECFEDAVALLPKKKEKRKIGFTS